MLRLPFALAASLVLGVVACGGATEGSETLPLEFELYSTSPPDWVNGFASATDRPALVGSSLFLLAKTPVRDGMYVVTVDDETIVSDTSALTACRVDGACQVQVVAKTIGIGFATLEVRDATGALVGIIRLHVRRPSAVGVKAQREGVSGFEDVSAGLVLHVGERVDLFPFATDGSGILVSGTDAFRAQVARTDVVVTNPSTPAPLTIIGSHRGATFIDVATTSGPSMQLAVDVRD